MSELAEHYGVRTRLASTVTLDLSTAEVISLDEEQLLERTHAAAARAIAADGAEVIVLAGSLMVELAPTLSRALGVPVLSGMTCGLWLASALAGLGAFTSAAYKYRTPLKHDNLIGYPELQDAYGARAASTLQGTGSG
jgi:allantoin racemase